MFSLPSLDISSSIKHIRDTSGKRQLTCFWAHFFFILWIVLSLFFPNLWKWTFLEFCPLLNFTACDRTPPPCRHTFCASFTNLNYFFIKMLFFVEVDGTFHRSSWSFNRSSENDSTDPSGFLQFLPLASTNFHRHRVTSGKSPYACISYHELQALPPWGREGRSFPGILYTRFPFGMWVIRIPTVTQDGKGHAGNTDSQSSCWWRQWIVGCCIILQQYGTAV